MLNESTKIGTNQDIVLRAEDEGAFLFEPDTGRIWFLNEVGMSIWKKLCEKPMTVEQIVREIGSRHPETPQEKVSKDCFKFINDLNESKLLSIKTD